MPIPLSTPTFKYPPVVGVSTDPLREVEAQKGALRYDADTGKLWCHDGAEWIAVGALAPDALLLAVGELVKVNTEIRELLELLVVKFS
jgi:hypothetical protein